MPKIFHDKGDDATVMDIEANIESLIHKKFQALREAKVTIAVLFVLELDKEGECSAPCLKHHGYPAAAVIRINPYEKRKQGLADCTLVIDKFTWDEKDERWREALLAHEITHIDLKVDKDGALLRDDCGRPKMKMRPHDWELGGFDGNAKAYGKHAPEVQAFMELTTHFRQLELAFG